MRLRAVAESDLDALYEQQADAESSAMAGVPSRDRPGFDAHWQRMLANDDVVVRTIDVDGEAAGHVLSWSAHGRRYIGYWLGREYWGRGLATAALADFVRELPERPLHALVSTDNVASIRVLEKCGFVVVGPADDKLADEGVPGFLYELRDAPPPGA